MSLVTSMDDLRVSSGNSGMTNARHRQVPPLRSVGKGNFASGNINYRFELAGNQRVNMAKSYLRIRFKITKGNGNQLELSDDIAPAMGFGSHLFKSAEFRIGQQTVSRVSDNMPRIDALKNRVRKSKSWMDTVGDSINFWNPSFQARQLDVVAALPGNAPITSYITKTAVEAGASNDDKFVVTGGVNISITNNTDAAKDIPNLSTTYKKDDLIVLNNVFYLIESVPDNRSIVLSASTAAPNGTVTGNNVSLVSVSRDLSGKTRKPKSSISHECIFQPPLSIFEYAGDLPVGRYELELTAQNETDYKKRCIESLNASKTPGSTGDFDIEIEDMNLYLYQYDKERVTNTSYYIDLDEIRCQRTQLDSTLSQQRQFDVSPSTYALTMALQDSRVTQSTEYRESKFLVGASGSAPADDKSRFLRNFYIAYGGMQQPSPNAELSLTNNKYQIVQLYNDTLMATGSYYDNGGSESVSEWKDDRGSYYCYSFERDGSDRSTRVTCQLDFDNGFVTGAANPQTDILLFDHYKTLVKVDVESGIVTNVSILEQ